VFLYFCDSKVSKLSSKGEGSLRDAAVASVFAFCTSKASKLRTCARSVCRAPSSLLRAAAHARICETETETASVVKYVLRSSKLGTNTASLPRCCAQLHTPAPASAHLHAIAAGEAIEARTRRHIRQHTSAYANIRQNTPAYTRTPARHCGGRATGDRGARMQAPATTGPAACAPRKSCLLCVVATRRSLTQAAREAATLESARARQWQIRYYVIRAAREAATLEIARARQC
jgi:hypothetical protein